METTDGKQGGGSEPEPLTPWEMEELSQLTEMDPALSDMDYFDNLVSELSRYTDIDEEELETLSVKQLDYIWDTLKIDELGDETPSLAVRLQKLKEIKELIAKINNK